VGGHYNLAAFRDHTSVRTLQQPLRRRMDFRLSGATVEERRFALDELAAVAGATIRTFDIVLGEAWGEVTGDKIATFNSSLR